MSTVWPLGKPTSRVPVVNEVWTAKNPTRTTGATIVYVHEASQRCSYVCEGSLMNGGFDYLNSLFIPPNKEPMYTETINPPTLRIPVKDEVWVHRNTTRNDTAKIVLVHEGTVAFITVNRFSPAAGTLNSCLLQPFLHSYNPPKEKWEMPKEITTYMVVDIFGKILSHLAHANAGEAQHTAKKTGYPGVVQVKITPVGDVIKA